MNSKEQNKITDLSKEEIDSLRIELGIPTKDNLKKTNDEKLRDYWNQQFEIARSLELLQKEQYNNDFQIISDKLIFWKSLLKEGSEKWLTLNIMCNALLRMFFYDNNLDTACRVAIVQNQDYRSEIVMLKEIIFKQKRENEALKKEIEFISK